MILFFEGYRKILQDAGEEVYNVALKKLKMIGMNAKGSKWRRVAATKTLNDLRGVFKEEKKEEKDEKKKWILKEKIELLTNYIDEIKSETEDKWLIDIYNYYNY